MKIIQYRPAYFEGYKNEENKFNSIDELLNIPWIKSFSKYDDFYQFSLERDKDGFYNFQHSLMAEFKKGKEWWVVGNINEKDIHLLDKMIEWKPR